MAEMYRRSKVEKFRKHLEKDLEMLAKSLETLKLEGISDGYGSLLSKYNTLFDLLDDYCVEFDLERPVYPSWWAFTGEAPPEDESTRMKVARQIREERNR